MTRRTVELAAFFTAILLAAFAFHAWLVSRDDQQRLQSTLAAQKQIIDSADARERTRETALNATLAQIDKLKRAQLTPEEVLRDLPEVFAPPAANRTREYQITTAGGVFVRRKSTEGNQPRKPAASF